MEQYPDVTVIFAMYEKEVKGFLELDEGLTSRISGMLHFPDYSVQELWQIAVKMAEDKGYILESSRCFDSFARYIINTQKKEGFGNARTVRKLTESAIIAACVRHMNEGKKKSSGMYLTGRDSFFPDSVLEKAKLYAAEIGNIKVLPVLICLTAREYNK